MWPAEPAALRALGPYRAIEATIEQNERRREKRLTMPVLAIGGAEPTGELVGQTMMSVADDVEVRVLGGCGHYPAEEQPDALLAVVLRFLTERRTTDE